MNDLGVGGYVSPRGYFPEGISGRASAGGYLPEGTFHRVTLKIHFGCSCSVGSPQVVERRLSKREGVSLKVQDIVHQLEGQADPLPVLERHLLHLIYDTSSRKCEQEYAGR